MTRDQALRKVLACLRRSASSNPNEAATALRQARALMNQYGLTEDDAAAAEIRDAGAPTRNRGKMVPQSTLALASMVADGYRCEIVVQCYEGNFLHVGRTAIRFFGAGADPEVAVYAFTVLNRQLQADKARHTLRIRKRANKDRRGEEFALGWIHAIRRLFPKEALPEGRDTAIAAAMRQRVGETQKTTGRELGKSGRANANDRYAGYQAGSNAQLHGGLSGETQRRLENG